MNKMFKLSPPYSLYRESDGRGDSGGHMVSIEPNSLEHYRGEVVEGCWIQVGSITARSYSQQDWWMCTPIKKISKIEAHQDGQFSINFDTNNSTYTLKGFNFSPLSEEVKQKAKECGVCSEERT